MTPAQHQSTENRLPAAKNGRPRKKSVMTQNISGLDLGDWVPRRPLGKNPSGASVWDMECRRCGGRSNVVVRSLDGKGVARCRCLTFKGADAAEPVLVRRFTDEEVQLILDKPTLARLAKGAGPAPATPAPEPEPAPPAPRPPATTAVPNAILRQILLAEDADAWRAIRAAVLALAYPE